MASVSGLFHIARSQGTFKANVNVLCEFRGTIGEDCSLYVDGEIVATRPLAPAQPHTYNGNEVDQCSFSIEVAANREHEFRVMTSEGELSNTVTEFAQFGRGTTVYLSTFGNKTTITVKGLFTGENNNPAVSLYIDGDLVETQHGEVPNRMEYEFTEEVYLQRHYVVKVMASSYWVGAVSNQTLAYVDRGPVNVSLDLGHPRSSKTDVIIRGNYSGADGTFYARCYIDDSLTGQRDIYSPGSLNYSFTVWVDKSQYHKFTLMLFGRWDNYISLNQTSVFVGNDTTYININLEGLATTRVTVRGNYTGNETRCKVYLCVNGASMGNEDIINPGYANRPLYAVLMQSRKIEAIQLRCSGMLHFDTSKWVCRISNSAYNFVCKLPALATNASHFRGW